MNTKIRDAIMSQGDLFVPGSNIGLGVEGMMMRSEALQSLDRRDVEAELELMRADGLVEVTEYGDESNREKSWSSTKNGQIETQRRITALGARSHAMAAQAKFDIADMVLALVAAPSVSSYFGSHPMRMDWLQVYLYDRDPQEAESAVKSLIDLKYVKVWQTPWGTDLVMSLEGLKYYRGTVRERLGLAEDQSILDAPPPASDDNRFLKLGVDKKLAANLEFRWQEALRCKDAGAAFSSVIMLGSILEGLLLAVLRKRIKRAMKAKSAPRDKQKITRPLDEWKLQNLIEVASEIGLVTAPAVKHAHDLRDSRNLIHPHKQIAEGIVVDETLLKISFEVVNAVLEGLIKSKEGSRRKS